MSTSRSVTAVLRAQDNGYTSTMTKASSLLRRLSGNTREASSSNQGFGSVLKGVVGALGVYKVAGMAFSSVTKNMGSAVSRLDTMNNFPKVMKQMGFSADESKSSIDRLSKGVQGLPTALNDVVSTTQRIASFNGDIGKATSTTLALNNAMLASGASSDAAGRGLEQYVQMMSAGKVDMQAWKTLQETMPYALQKTAEAFGLTGTSAQKDLYEKLKEGEITFDQFNDKLIELSEAQGGFAETAKTATAGIGTAFTNLKNATVRGTAAMITSFDSLLTKLTGTNLQGHIENIGKTFEKNLKKMGTLLEKTGEFISPFVVRVQNMIKRVKEPVTNAFNAVKASLEKLWGQFDKTGALTSFQGFLDNVAISIERFSGFVEKNSDSIAKMIATIPKLVGALMTLNVVKSVGQKFAGFGAEVLKATGKMLEVGNSINARITQNVITPIGTALSNGMSILQPYFSMFGENFRFSMQALTEYDDKGKFLNFTRSIGESLSAMFPKFDAFRANVRASKSQLDQFGGSSIGNFLRSVGASLDLTDSKFGKFAATLLHPISSVKTLGSSLALFSAQSGGAGTVVSGLGLKVASSLKSMASVGIGAIRSLSLAMLSNPITAVLLALDVGVAGFAMAWKSNFMNVQGYTKSVFKGVGESLSSLGGMFDGILPKGVEMGDVMKDIGVIFAKVLGVAIGIVVDAFRLLVAAVAIVIKGFMALGNAAKMVGKALTGDFKGASEAFDDVKDNISSMGDTMKNFVDNSATKKAVESFSELKDVSGEAAKQIKIDYQALGQSSQEFANKVSETSNKVKEAFKFDEASDNSPSTAGMAKYFENATQLMGNYQQNKQAMVEESNSMIQAAQDGSDEEQLEAQIAAASNILNTVSTTNQGVLAMYQEHSQMLKTNKTLEGQELTQEQRTALQEQTEMIRQELIAQNQLYVDAGVQKLQNGAKLDEQERQTVITNLQALYANKAEEVTSNEAKIAELQNEMNQAKTESEKLNYQAQIEGLKTNNAQIQQEYMANGDAILQVLLNGNETKASTVLQGLESMKNITDQQLTALFNSFAANNQNTDQQLALLAGIMQQRSVEGATNLVSALQSGDTKNIGTSITADVQAGLSTLPEGMFVNGSSGRNQFIQALKSGDTVSAGKTLVDGAASGADGQLAKIGDSGSKSGKEYSDKVDSKKTDANKAGKDVAESTTKGMKQEQSNQQEAGRQSGTKYNEGVRSQKK